MSERRYDKWAGNPKGNPENKTHCVEEVNPPPYWHLVQCSRKRGYGPNGEYCKQHAKKLAERENFNKSFTSSTTKGEIKQ